MTVFCGVSNARAEFAGLQWHFHQDAFNVLVHGRKRWYLLPPAAAVLSTEHPQRSVAAAAIAAGRARSAAACNTSSGVGGDGVGGDGVGLGGPQECVQQAGDILYVPDSWVRPRPPVRLSLDGLGYW